MEKELDTVRGAIPGVFVLILVLKFLLIHPLPPRFPPEIRGTSIPICLIPQPFPNGFEPLASFILHQQFIMQDRNLLRRHPTLNRHFTTILRHFCAIRESFSYINAIVELRFPLIVTKEYPTTSPTCLVQSTVLDPIHHTLLALCKFLYLNTLHIITQQPTAFTGAHLKMIELLILFLILALMSALLYILYLRRTIPHQIKVQVQRQVKTQVQQALKKSRAVIKGKIHEQLAPFLDAFPFQAGDARFLGSPIDYIIFNGLCQQQLTEVVLIDIKTGNASLTKTERQIKHLVDQRKVRWMTIRL